MYPGTYDKFLVAVKVLNEFNGSMESEELQEILLGGMIPHMNISRILGWFISEDHEKLHIVMERHEMNLAKQLRWQQWQLKSGLQALGAH